MTTGNATAQRTEAVEGGGLLPLYEVRLKKRAANATVCEVRQLPAPATPRLKHPEWLGAIGGRNWLMLEDKLLRQLKAGHLAIGRFRPGERVSYTVPEDMALRFALLFRVLAPMQNIERIRTCRDQIDALSREEASYWLGMVMHRRHPRQVLQALRTLLLAT